MKKFLLCVLSLLLILNTVNVFASTEIINNFDDVSYTFPTGTATNANHTMITLRYDSTQKEQMASAVSEGKWLQISTEIVVPANGAFSTQLYLNGVKSDGSNAGGWINHTISLPVSASDKTHKLSYLCDLTGKKVYIFFNDSLYATTNPNTAIANFGESVFVAKYIGSSNTTLDYTVQYKNIKAEIVSQSLNLLVDSDVKVNEPVKVGFSLPVDDFAPVLKVGNNTIENLVVEPKSNSDKFNWEISLADGIEWEYETTYTIEYEGNTYSFTTEDLPPLEISLSKTSNVGVTEELFIQFSRATENADEYITISKNSEQIENYTISSEDNRDWMIKLQPGEEWEYGASYTVTIDKSIGITEDFTEVFSIEEMGEQVCEFIIPETVEVDGGITVRFKNPVVAAEGVITIDGFNQVIYSSSNNNREWTVYPSGLWKYGTTYVIRVSTESGLSEPAMDSFTTVASEYGRITLLDTDFENETEGSKPTTVGCSENGVSVVTNPSGEGKVLKVVADSKTVSGFNFSASNDTIDNRRFLVHELDFMVEKTGEATVQFGGINVRGYKPTDEEGNPTLEKMAIVSTRDGKNLKYDSNGKKLTIQNVFEETNEWKHVMFVCDFENDNVTMYLNGEQVAKSDMLDSDANDYAKFIYLYYNSQFVSDSASASTIIYYDNIKVYRNSANAVTYPENKEIDINGTLELSYVNDFDVEELKKALVIKKDGTEDKIDYSLQLDNENKIIQVKPDRLVLNSKYNFSIADTFKDCYFQPLYIPVENVSFSTQKSKVAAVNDIVLLGSNKVNIFTENKTNTDVNATLIICIYDANDILKSISKEIITIPANAEAFRTTLTLENFDSGMSLKVAVYQNDGALKPLSSFLHK